MRYKQYDDAFSSEDLEIYSSRSKDSKDAPILDFYKDRKGRFTASEIWKLMGNGKRKGELSLTSKSYINKKVAELLVQDDQFHLLPRIDSVWAIRWGNEHELAGIYEAGCELGVSIEKTGSDQSVLKHETLPVAGTPDGLIGCDGLIEIKCPYSPENHIENLSLTSDTIASVRSEYFYQMQCLMWLSGRNYCYFVSYDPRMKQNKQLAIVKVFRCEATISDMQNRVVEATRIMKQYI